MIRPMSLTAMVMLSIAIISASAEEDKEAQSRSPRFMRDSDEFAKSGLKIGDGLPNLTAYDADGKPFKLSQLKGSYSVIVLGCLT